MNVFAFARNYSDGCGTDWTRFSVRQPQNSTTSTAVTSKITKMDPASKFGGEIGWQQRKVFSHLAQRRNAPEIAQLLTVSEATIRTHVASILEKLALRDRVQLMAYAIKRGIVQAEDLM